MNMNAMKSNNGKRLIAAFVALAMIVCAVAFVATPASADTMDVVDSSDFTTGSIIIDSSDELKTLSILYETYDVVILDLDGTTPITSFEITDIKVPAGKTLVIGADGYDANGYNDDTSPVGNTADVVITVTNLNIDGTLYNNVGATKSTSGLKVTNLTLGANGALYSTCALEWGSGSKVTGFFTNSNGAFVDHAMTEYRNMYAGNINTLIPYVNNADYGGASITGAKAIFTYGDVTISQNTVLTDLTLYVGGVGTGNESKLTIAENATLTINANAKVATATNNSNSSVDNDGTINLYGTIATAIDNSGSVKILSDKADYSGSKFSGNGTIDSSAISNEGSISGTYGDDETGSNVFNIAPNQIVTVTDNLTLVNTFQLNVKGTLVIPEGVTVTIQDAAGIYVNSQSAKIENNGTIVIESKVATSDGSSTGGLIVAGGSVVNNGTVNLNYFVDTTAGSGDSVGDNLYINQGTFTNNGTLTIGTESILNVVAGMLVNGADATFTVNGNLTSKGTIENSGEIAFNGKTSGATISLASEGASVVITSVTTTDHLVIDNAAIDDKKVAANYDKNTGVVISATGSNYMGGLTVTAVIYDGTYNDEDAKLKGIDLAGSAALGTTSTEANAKATGIMTLYGTDMKVTGEFSVGAGLTLNLGHSGRGALNLDVSGTMNVTAPLAGTSTMTINGHNAEITVSGEIVSLVNLKKDGINPNAAVYTTTANAIQTYHYTSLSKAIATGVTPIDVYGTVEVTEDVTIPSGITVRQQASSTIEVAEGVTLTVANGGIVSNGNVTVKGTLYIEVENTGFRNGTAVSDVKSTDGTDARYTNLVNAMNLAESGDTVKLYNQDGVTIDSPLVIKEGVTLDTDGKDLTVQGTTLTINGTLFINGGTFSVVKGKATESGYQAPANVVLSGYVKSNEYIAYAEGTDANPSWTPAGAYYTIAENGVPRYYISTVSNGIAAINGAENDTVTLHGEMGVGNVTVTGTEESNATVVIANDADITGNFTLSYAVLSITAGAGYAGTVADANGSISIPTDAGFQTNTTFTADVDDEGVATFTIAGNVAAGQKKTVVVDGEATLGNVTIDNLTVDGTADAVGNVVISGTLTVNGTVNIEPNGILTVNAQDSKAVVLGSLVVAEATASTAAGNATITTIYVGIGFDEEGKFADSTDATVSGAVNAKNVYVSSGSTVPEAMTAEDDIEFFIEGDLWMTYYGTTAIVDGAPIVDAKFEGWSATEGGDVIGGNTPATKFTNSTYDVLYAIVDYDVYNVLIRTDGGIASVAVDGVVLATYQSSNQFIATNLTAGQHTVTYTLKAGFGGEATLSSNNVTVSGLTFTVSGDYENTDYLISLTGITATDYSQSGSSDGMGLTEILLVILVILIVVMAIMVALRLMRS